MSINYSTKVKIGINILAGFTIGKTTVNMFTQVEILELQTRSDFISLLNNLMFPH